MRLFQHDTALLLDRYGKSLAVGLPKVSMSKIHLGAIFFIWPQAGWDGTANQEVQVRHCFSAISSEIFAGIYVERADFFRFF